MIRSRAEWWTRFLVVWGLVTTAAVSGCWSFAAAGEKTDTSPWVVVGLCVGWGAFCGWLGRRAYNGWEV